MKITITYFSRAGNPFHIEYLDDFFRSDMYTPWNYVNACICKRFPLCPIQGLPYGVNLPSWVLSKSNWLRSVSYFYPGNPFALGNSEHFVCELVNILGPDQTSRYFANTAIWSHGSSHKFVLNLTTRISNTKISVSVVRYRFFYFLGLAWPRCGDN